MITESKWIADKQDIEVDCVNKHITIKTQMKARAFYSYIQDLFYNVG